MMELNERKVELAIMGELAKEQVPVTVILTNGFQVQGVVARYDLLVLVLQCGQEQRIIYKHSISSITPHKPLSAAQGKS